jgi:hypothetical protein
MRLCKRGVGGGKYVERNMRQRRKGKLEEMKEDGKVERK